MLVMLCEEGKMIFYLFGMNGFYLKVKDERFIVVFLKKFVFKSYNCLWLLYCFGNMLCVCVC